MTTHGLQVDLAWEVDFDERLEVKMRLRTRIPEAKTRYTRKVSCPVSWFIETPPNPRARAGGPMLPYLTIYMSLATLGFPGGGASFSVFPTPTSPGGGVI